MVDLCNYFANFVRGDGICGIDCRPAMFNVTDKGNLEMRTEKIGKHSVEFYDAIDELPIVRFHKYQKLLLVDAGVGADIAAFDQHIEKVRRYILDDKLPKAAKEIENLRQCVYLIQSGISPQHLAFATLVTKIDGRECNDLTDDALSEIVKQLGDVPQKKLTATFEAVKKKIDAELMLYFPTLFNGSEIKEYYDLLKRRTLEILKGIIEGLDNPMDGKEVERLTAALITYSNPKSFEGSEGVEVQFDRQFENLCLVLSEQMHVEPKKYTVLEFYNAFDFVKERARQAEKAQKRPVGAR